LNHTTQHIARITTRHLSIGYTHKGEQLLIAKELNLHADKGNFVAIIGKNGSGKSTLLRTLAGIQSPLSGNINIRNQKITDYTANELAQQMAVVFTEPLPDSLLQVHELISLGRQVYTNWMDQLTEKDMAVMDTAIELTGIRPLLSRFYNELSDGQKQKALIARAITQDTPILLLDEPTAHLDIHHRMESFLLLKKLATTYQKTIIIATHEIGLAMQLADAIWLLDQQQIQAGTPEVFIENDTISAVFDSDLIQFNAHNGSFEYKKHLNI